MISTSLRTAFAVALIAPLVLVDRPGARAQGQGPLEVTLSRASVSPGDVMRIEVHAAADRTISATLFGQQLPFSFDDQDAVWSALAGVDLDTRPGRYRLRIRQDDVLNTTRIVRVVPKQFRVRRLRVPKNFVNPPAEVVEQIIADSKLLNETYERATPPQWEGAFRLPVDGKPSSNFGTRSYYNGQRRSPHSGIDFSSESGTPVSAANFGTVAVAAPLYFTGNTVVIDHGARLYSVYAHLSELRVTAGDRVTPDTVVGLVGATGRVTGPHLHWSIRLNGARVDPLSLIAATQQP